MKSQKETIKIGDAVKICNPLVFKGNLCSSFEAYDTESDGIRRDKASKIAWVKIPIETPGIVLKQWSREMFIVCVPSHGLIFASVVFLKSLY